MVLLIFSHIEDNFVNTVSVFLLVKHFFSSEVSSTWSILFFWMNLFSSLEILPISESEIFLFAGNVWFNSLTTLDNVCSLNLLRYHFACRKIKCFSHRLEISIVGSYTSIVTFIPIESSIPTIVSLTLPQFSHPLPHQSGGIAIECIWFSLITPTNDLNPNSIYSYSDFSFQ